MRYFFSLAALLLPFAVFTQSISGQVKNTDGEPLVGASVYWLANAEGTYTNEEGAFELPWPSTFPQRLVTTYVGFQSDTIQVNSGLKSHLEITLSATKSLETVVVTEQELGTYISSTNPIKTEAITEKELTRSACCDLAGCFNTQGSVQPNTTNIVTDAKELRILGLSGVYNQVLIDGFPLIQGSSYTYGISAIPGTLVKTIFVSKGANSVLQGFESIAGQINVILKTPEEGPRLFLNTYLNTFGEQQYNANLRHRWNRWSTIVGAHVARPAEVRDRDADLFLDVPQLKRYSLFNKWKYRNANEWGKHAEISLRYVEEERQGGQTFFDPTQDLGGTDAYGQVVEFSQPEFSTKLGYRMDDYHHFVLHLSGFRHRQSSVFGTTQYESKHWNGYANLQYELNWLDNYQLKAGASYRLQDLQEEIRFSDADPLDRTFAGTYHKQEYIPGWFIENVSNWYDDRLTLITGLRWDHHNRFGGRWTPRALLRAKLSAATVARLSAGSGWRTINLFAENVNLLATSRDAIISDDLAPEAAWNYGFNLTHNTYGDNVETQWSLDLYHTAFDNQIFPDFDSNPTTVQLSNFFGTSISNAAQLEMGLALYKRLGLKLAYNFLDVYRTIDGEKQQLPFNARHRIVSTFSFEPLSKTWHLDANLHWHGEQVLVNATEPTLGQAERSDPYVLFNVQVTKVWPQLEVYLGCENLFDFRQLRPIRSWQDPFGPLFDTANVWGPTQGRELHLGVRYRVDYKEE